MKLAVIKALVAVVVTLVTAGPMAVGGCASALSRDQEIALGEENAPKFLAEGGGAIPSGEINQYVEQIGRKIVSQIPPGEERNLPWEFHAINSAEINAFALPGGKIFVSRGLMERMTNEAQLAAVLGHEVGHVVAQHIGKQMQRQMNINIGLQVLSVATENAWANTLGGIGGQLYLLSFSREQETEADDYGLTYMVKAGYNPVGMVQLHEILINAAGRGNAAEFLSTHPDPGRRREAAAQRINAEFQFTQNNPKYILDTGDFQNRALGPLRALPPAKAESMREMIGEDVAQIPCSGCGAHSPGHTGHARGS
jgi:predicted Zn-dependent protease